MAKGLLKGFWTFLNTDVRQLPWGELTKTGAEATKAALEASKTGLSRYKGKKVQDRLETPSLQKFQLLPH